MQAGRSSGDLVFPLVFCPELHFSEFNSAVADMKNSVAVGGVSFTNCDAVAFMTFMCSAEP